MNKKQWNGRKGEMQGEDESKKRKKKEEKKERKKFTYNTCT